MKDQDINNNPEAGNGAQTGRRTLFAKERAITEDGVFISLQDTVAYASEDDLAQLPPVAGPDGVESAHSAREEATAYLRMSADYANPIRQQPIVNGANQSATHGFEKADAMGVIQGQDRMTSGHGVGEVMFDSSVRTMATMEKRDITVNLMSALRQTGVPGSAESGKATLSFGGRYLLRGFTPYVSGTSKKFFDVVDLGDQTYLGVVRDPAILFSERTVVHDKARRTFARALADKQLEYLNARIEGRDAIAGFEEFVSTLSTLRGTNIGGSVSKKWSNEFIKCGNSNDSVAYAFEALASSEVINLIPYLSVAGFINMALDQKCLQGVQSTNVDDFLIDELNAVVGTDVAVNTAAMSLFDYWLDMDSAKKYDAPYKIVTNASKTGTVSSTRDLANGMKYYLEKVCAGVVPKRTADELAKILEYGRLTEGKLGNGILKVGDEVFFVLPFDPNSLVTHRSISVTIDGETKEMFVPEVKYGYGLFRETASTVGPSATLIEFCPVWMKNLITATTLDDTLHVIRNVKKSTKEGAVKRLVADVTFPLTIRVGRPCLWDMLWSGVTLTRERADEAANAASLTASGRYSRLMKSSTVVPDAVAAYAADDVDVPALFARLTASDAHIVPATHRTFKDYPLLSDNARAYVEYRSGVFRPMAQLPKVKLKYAVGKIFQTHTRVTSKGDVLVVGAPTASNVNVEYLGDYEFTAGGGLITSGDVRTASDLIKTLLASEKAKFMHIPGTGFIVPIIDGFAVAAAWAPSDDGFNNANGSYGDEMNERSYTSKYHGLQQIVVLRDPGYNDIGVFAKGMRVDALQVCLCDVVPLQKQSAYNFNKDDAEIKVSDGEACPDADYAKVAAFAPRGMRFASTVCDVLSPYRRMSNGTLAWLGLPYAASNGLSGMMIRGHAVRSSYDVDRTPVSAAFPSGAKVALDKYVALPDGATSAEIVGIRDHAVSSCATTEQLRYVARHAVSVRGEWNGAAVDGTSVERAYPKSISNIVALELLGLNPSSVYGYFNGGFCYSNQMVGTSYHLCDNTAQDDSGALVSGLKYTLAVTRADAHRGETIARCFWGSPQFEDSVYTFIAPNYDTRSAAQIGVQYDLNVLSLASARTNLDYAVMHSGLHGAYPCHVGYHATRHIRDIMHDGGGASEGEPSFLSLAESLQ